MISTEPIAADLTVLDKQTFISGYRLSKHARMRMDERHISAEDVRDVIEDPMTMCEVDCAGIAHYRGRALSRPIRVTVNELGSVIVTVAAPMATNVASRQCSSRLKHGI
jgi:hypothetical protein